MIQRLRRAAKRVAVVKPFGGRLSTTLPMQVGDRVIEIPVFNGLEVRTQMSGWKARVLKTLLPLRAGVFVDVGANMGQTLLDVLAAGGERPYIGWEPNPTCVYYLQTLIAHNQLHWCTIVPTAVADYSGIARLYHHPNVSSDTAATIIDGLRPRHTNLTSTIVPVAAFDAAWRVLGPGSIGFVKIDVEGAELQVLRGMADTLSTERPPILCEILLAPRGSRLEDAAARNADMEELLRQHEYSILHLVKPAGVMTKVERIASLPLEYWSEEKNENRDYVLIPREHEAEYLAALSSLVKPA